MLKFRMTNSMKARKAAEAQRKILEEKLKMEWAWKPMAAVMNEKETDLVYWVPPIYTSNLITSFSSSTSMSSSLTSTPSSSFKRSSTRILSQNYNQESPLRRKRLARRRAKLSPEQSIQEDNETEEKNKKKEDATTDDDKESGIQDEFLDSSVDEEVRFEENVIKEKNFFNPYMFNKPQISSKKEKKLTKKKEKFKHIPTLLKVIDKLSQIYTLPQNPPPMFGATRPYRLKELRNNSVKKQKRPSVKIYRVPSYRSSIKKNEDPETQNPFYVITKNKTPFGSKRTSIRSNKEPVSRTHIGLPTLTENELRNAHLEMILKILSNLYEDQITNQGTEISHLKSKLQAQEKVIRQTVILVLDLKDQLKTLQAKFDFDQELKKFYKHERAEAEPNFPYHPLEPLQEETHTGQLCVVDDLSTGDSNDNSHRSDLEFQNEIPQDEHSPEMYKSVITIEFEDH